MLQATILPLFTPRITRKKKAVQLSPKEADKELIKLLNSKTIEDPNYWSLPDRNRRQSAHALFQYPAMMVPEVQRRLVEAICTINPKISTLYDPFVGSGTAVVAGMRNGLECVGQDINPLAVLLARVKTSPFRYRTLKSKVLSVVKTAKRDSSEEIEVSFPGINKWFRLDVQIELSRLRRAIIQQPDDARPFLWVTLAETIRLTSNDRTSTFKLHARDADEIQKRTIQVIATFETLATKGCTDLKSFHFNLAEAGMMVKRNTYKGHAHIALQNTQEQAAALPGNTEQKFDLLITSPPYGDNTTTVPYGQHSYLALNWIRLADIEQGVDPSLLATTHEIDKRSLGGSLEQRKHLQELQAQLGTKSPLLSTILDKLATSSVKGTVTRIASFYRDLDTCLDNILLAMNSQAYLCWTVANRRVGNVEIPIDGILIELLAAHNVKLVTSIDRVIHHKRMASRNNTADTMKKERILIFRTA